MHIEDIQKLREATEKLSYWESSKRVFGHIDFLDRKRTDRMYEFYCLMRIIGELLANNTIELIPNADGKRLFPFGPAKKPGWSKFIVTTKDVPALKFQVCYGTEIKLSSSPTTTIAPDISIQKIDATDDPDETQIEMIMDAQYKEDENKKLDIKTIREFAQCVRDLEVEPASALSLKFDSLKSMPSNTLLTNAHAIEKHGPYCKHRKIVQIGDFDCDGRAPQEVP